MAQPARHRRHTPISLESSGSPPDRSVLLAAGWLLAYCLIFFSLPLRELGDARRGEVFLTLLLRPDDFVANWIAGASMTSLAERGWILFLAVAILSVSAAAGWILLRSLRVDRLVSRLEMSLLAAIAGFNLVSLATLLLGLAGLLRAELMIGLGVSVCIAAAVWRRLGGCASGTCTIANVWSTDEHSPWNWNPQWLWLCVPFTLVLIGSAMLPPLDFDVREYHLQAPKEFYQAGRITFLPHNVYANMPLGAEMFALAGMVISGDWWTGALVGKTVIALFAPLGSLLLFAAGARWHSPAAGIVAALAYVSLPWLAIVSTHGLIEGVFACYLLAALYGAVIWRDSLPIATNVQQTNAGVLVLAGFLAGAAVSTKYPAVVYCAVPLTVLVACWAWRNSGPRFAAKATSLVVLGLLLGCGPWLAKNAVLAGNPTYPLLYRVFGGETRTPEKEAQWQRVHSPANYQMEDFAKQTWDVAIAGTWLSPLLVPLAVLALCNKALRRRAALFAAAFALIFVLWWVLTHRIDRFLVPAWPLAALVAGLGATWNTNRLWRRILAAFLAVGLIYDFVVIAGGPAADNRYFAPLAELKAQSVAIDPWHRWLNDSAAEVQKVLLVGDAQPFDLEVPAIYNTVFDDSIFEQLAREKSPAQVRDALRELGVSHVYVSWPEIERYRSPGNYGITEFLQPRIFTALVDAGVFEPVPMLADSRGQMFRVIAQ